MLKSLIIGNLGADAELRVSNGQQFLSFRVAHSDRWTDKTTGEIHENTQWISCTLNGDGGGVRKYLTRGTKVFIYGDLLPKLYVSSKDGKQYAGLDCRVRQLELCGSGAAEYTAEGVAQFLTNCPKEIRDKITNALPF